MYKVLIVDDEPLARLGLKETINWSDYGFEIAGDADNAVSATEMYKKLKPDVIITDICMEPIDGLTLIENLQKYNSDLEFIVISGYSDFNYAQTAMKYGVSSYLLKPIENDDLTETLEILKSKLDQKRETNKILAEYNDRRNESHLAALLTCNDDIDMLYAKLCSEGFVFPDNKNYIVVNMQIDNISKETDNQKEPTALLLKLAKSRLASANHFALYTTLKNNHVILIVFEDNNGKSIPEQLLKEIMNVFASQSGKYVTVGISGIVNRVGMLSRAFMQSKKALARKAVLGNNKIIYYTSKFEDNAPQSAPVFSSKQTEELIEAITLGNQGSAKAIIDSYFNSIKALDSVDLDEIKNTIINTTVYIMQRYIRTPEMMQMIFKRNVHPAKEIWDMETTDDIYAWLSEFTDTLTHNRHVKNFSSYSTLIQNVITYIMSNYAKNLDINLVAKQFYVSGGHLMRQFKQETGKTFLEYLTEYRISIAITLLQNTNYKIYEVCEMVGYANTKYFGKIFKRITGKSPKDFMS